MVIETVVYGLLGIVLMLLAFTAINLVIPYNFIHEIFYEKNPAVGAMAAGIFIAIAIIVRAAII